MVQSQGPLYDVAGAISADQFAISGSWALTTQNQVSYAVIKDYSPNYSFPYPTTGDLDAVRVVGEAINQIDLQVASVSGQSTVVAGTVLDFTQSYLLTKAVTSTPLTLSTAVATPPPTALLRLVLTAGASGPYNVTISGVTWEGGSNPLTAIQDNDMWIVNLYYDGSDYFGSASGPY
jgi:hypothetical protein